MRFAHYGPTICSTSLCGVYTAITATASAAIRRRSAADAQLRHIAAQLPIYAR